MTKIMPENEYKKHVARNDGYCIECGNIVDGNIDPDNVNYLCPECGKKQVVGFVTAALYGWIVPAEEKKGSIK